MSEDTELTPLDMSFLDSIPHTYRLLASGGIAGCVAKTITAPLSRLTILFQVCVCVPGCVRACLRECLRACGRHVRVRACQS